ncbi:hypothetical protein Tco_1038093 [Tanacetum coccineum]
MLVIKRFRERKKVFRETKRERNLKNLCKEVCFSAENSAVFMASDGRPSGKVDPDNPMVEKIEVWEVGLMTCLNQGLRGNVYVCNLNYVEKKINSEYVVENVLK